MRLIPVLAVGAVAAGILGCGFLSSSDDGSEVARYFPLTVGNEWQYSTAAGDGEPIPNADRVVRVVAVEGGWAHVKDGRCCPEEMGGIVRYRVRDGVWMRRDGDETQLIRKPLVVGSRWDQRCGEGGYEITCADTSISTVAATFTDVLVVRLMPGYCPGDPIDKTAYAQVWYGAYAHVWYYAPGVGLVREEIINLTTSPRRIYRAYDLVSYITH